MGDLGVAKLITHVDATNTRAQWMLPPEVLNPAEFGPMDHRIVRYHLGLLFLQLAYSKELCFTKEGILAGKPRDMALALQAPHSFALEKALRRRVEYRTATALELCATCTRLLKALVRLWRLRMPARHLLKQRGEEG